jgi:hypothetical protein
VATVELDVDGIVRIHHKPQAAVDLDDAQELIGMVASAFGRRRPGLVDLTGVRSLSRGARKYFAGQEASEVVAVCALLVTSPLATAIGNFFMGFDRPLSPTRLFTSEAEALEWLRSSLP